jgi:tetratricopeptide (TPR) repeat protein
MGAQRRVDPTELTSSDKKQARKDHRKTREQRLADQLATDDGRAAYADNLGHAEDAYRRALTIDPTFAAAHRGLGEVYEQEKRAPDAATEYLLYVRSAPDADDRSIVVGRLKALTVKLKETTQ